ncbi:MAG: recombinase family protein [Oscillospiraceae bacterium]|nr:recombinase family protein [Oscillospiraceae bacterium]
MELKIAAAYVRVSTDDQLEYSPDSQLKIIREHAKRDGYIIPDEYIFREEDGISGKSAEKRPAFRLMIATAKETPAPFEAIFVWKYSRFARNQEEAIMYKNLLSKRGISVRSISEPSTDSPFSSLIERIIEWMDEYYLINLAGEVRRGMTEKATRGEAMGGAPLGYTVKDKKFVPDENADTVRFIYQSYLSGLNRREIVQALSAKGLKGVRGGVFSDYTVRYILTNPVYIGKIRWSTDGHANYSRADYNGDNVMLVDGKHEPIIDLATWEAVQKRIAERAEPKYVRKEHDVYMLKGLIRCDDCGSTLVRQTVQNSLQCYRYVNGSCKTSHYISIRKADKAVIEYLEDVVKTKAFKIAPKAPRKGSINRDWDKLIASEKAKLDRAREALLNGAFTPDEYKNIKAGIEETISKLEESKMSASSTVAFDADAYADKVKSVLDILKSPDVTGAVKNEALSTIVDKIVFSKPSNELLFYFKP